MDKTGKNGWGNWYYMASFYIGYSKPQLTGKYILCSYDENKQKWNVTKENAPGSAPKDFKIEDFIENGLK